jgi:hypothetical protein
VLRYFVSFVLKLGLPVFSNFGTRVRLRPASGGIKFVLGNYHTPRFDRLLFHPRAIFAPHALSMLQILPCPALPARRDLFKSLAIRGKALPSILSRPWFLPVFDLFLTRLQA